MGEKLIKVAIDFFKIIETSTLGEKELSRYDHVFKFRSSDSNDYFEVTINKGRFTICECLNNDVINDIKQELIIESNLKTFMAIFNNKESFMDAWFSNRLRIIPILGKRWIVGWLVRLFKIGQDKTISPKSIFYKKINEDRLIR